MANKVSRRLIGHAEYYLANAEYSLEAALNNNGLAGLTDSEKSIVGNALRNIEEINKSLTIIEPKGR